MKDNFEDFFKHTDLNYNDKRISVTFFLLS